jgi:guanine deaminase
MSEQQATFMRQALALAARGIELGHGGPFGAVVVMEGKIVGEGCNQVVLRKDPTAHAEMLAIRMACETLGQFHLPDATLYTTCEPCPMCMGALYWARINHLVYAASAEDAAEFGFDDRLFKEQIGKPMKMQTLQITQCLRSESQQLFRRWSQSDKRIDY